MLSSRLAVHEWGHPRSDFGLGIHEWGHPALPFLGWAFTGGGTRAPFCHALLPAIFSGSRFGLGGMERPRIKSSNVNSLRTLSTVSCMTCQTERIEQSRSWAQTSAWPEWRWQKSAS